MRAPDLPARSHRPPSDPTAARPARGPGFRRPPSGTVPGRPEMIAAPNTVQPAPARPVPLQVEPLRIPAELQERRQWVVWKYGLRDGAWTKIPYQVDGRTRAESDNPKTWTTFTRALRAYRDTVRAEIREGGTRFVHDIDGIGFMFADDDPYFGVDIDKVRGNPEREAWALGIVERFRSYAEWTAGGAGLHIIGKGRMPGDEQRGRNNRKKGLEAYCRLRFFTFTGHIVNGAPAKIGERQKQLDWLLTNEFTAQASAAEIVKLAHGAVGALRDDDRARLDKMFNGKRGGELRDLYNGGSKNVGPDGTPDTSGDDLSLMNGLAFYLDKDPSRMASAFLSSGRNRPKLHERHSADGRTYLEMTIGEALAGCAQSYGDLVARAPKIVFPEPAPTVEGAEAPDELAELRVALDAATAENGRLRGTIDNLADVIHVQQTRIADVVPKLEARNEFLSNVMGIIAKPNEELSAGEKVVSIALAYEIHFRADKETYRLHDGTEGSYLTPSGKIRMTRNVIAKRSGYSPNKGAALARRVAERENAPFGWGTTRDWKTRADGSEGWVTTIEIEPRTTRTADTLRAIAALSALPEKPKHGGSKAASEARWNRCDEHQDADIIVKGYCATCGKVLGERTVTHADRADLKVQDGIPENPPPPVDVYVLKGIQDGIPDGLDELADGRAAVAMAIPMGRAPDAWKQPGEPISDSHERASLGPLVVKPKGHDASDRLGSPTPTRTAPWRCACGSYERKLLPDGAARCARGHVSRDEGGAVA